MACRPRVSCHYTEQVKNHSERAGEKQNVITYVDRHIFKHVYRKDKEKEKARMTARMNERQKQYVIGRVKEGRKGRENMRKGGRTGGRESKTKKW